MHKLNAVLEGKVGSCRNCDVEVLALDITEYVEKVFFIGEAYSVTHNMENYLQGQAKVTFRINPQNREISDIQAIRDSRELPTVKGEDVESFFSRHHDVAAVVYFWHGFRYGGESEGNTYPVNSKIAVNTNPATPVEKRLPWDLAFTLANVMNEGNPFTVAGLRIWGNRHAKDPIVRA